MRPITIIFVFLISLIASSFLSASNKDLYQKLDVFGDVFGLMSIVLTSCKGFPQSHQCYLADRMLAIKVVGVAMILVTVRSFGNVGENDVV